MSVFPVRDQIVVLKEKEEEKKTPGGIITVSLSTSKNVSGVVVAVGSGRVTMSGTVVPLEVREGDKVMFNPSIAAEVQVDGQTFYVLREDAVVCVLR